MGGGLSSVVVDSASTMKHGVLNSFTDTNTDNYNTNYEGRYTDKHAIGNNNHERDNIALKANRSIVHTHNPLLITPSHLGPTPTKGEATATVTKDVTDQDPTAPISPANADVTSADFSATSRSTLSDPTKNPQLTIVLPLSHTHASLHSSVVSPASSSSSMADSALSSLSSSQTHGSVNAGSEFEVSSIRSSYTASVMSRCGLIGESNPVSPNARIGSSLISSSPANGLGIGSVTSGNFSATSAQGSNSSSSSSGSGHMSTQANTHPPLSHRRLVSTQSTAATPSTMPHPPVASPNEEAAVSSLHSSKSRLRASANTGVVVAANAPTVGSSIITSATADDAESTKKDVKLSVTVPSSSPQISTPQPVSTAIPSNSALPPASSSPLLPTATASASASSTTNSSATSSTVSPNATSPIVPARDAISPASFQRTNPHYYTEENPEFVEYKRKWEHMRELRTQLKKAGGFREGRSLLSSPGSAVSSRAHSRAASCASPFVFSPMASPSESHMVYSPRSPTIAVAQLTNTADNVTTFEYPMPLPVDELGAEIATPCSPVPGPFVHSGTLFAILVESNRSSPMPPSAIPGFKIYSDGATTSARGTPTARSTGTSTPEESVAALSAHLQSSSSSSLASPSSAYASQLTEDPSSFVRASPPRILRAHHQRTVSHSAQPVTTTPSSEDRPPIVHARGKSIATSGLSANGAPSTTDWRHVERRLNALATSAYSSQTPSPPPSRARALNNALQAPSLVASSSGASSLASSAGTSTRDQATTAHAATTTTTTTAMHSHNGSFQSFRVASPTSQHRARITILPVSSSASAISTPSASSSSSTFPLIPSAATSSSLTLPQSTLSMSSIPSNVRASRRTNSIGQSIYLGMHPSQGSTPVPQTPKSLVAPRSNGNNSSLHSYAQSFTAGAAQQMMPTNTQTASSTSFLPKVGK